MHEAKRRLSELAKRVEKGEIVVITRGGKPCMDLVPHRRSREPRLPGVLKNQVTIAQDFDLTPEVAIEAFEQG